MREFHCTVCARQTPGERCCFSDDGPICMPCGIGRVLGTTRAGHTGSPGAPQRSPGTAGMDAASGGIFVLGPLAA